MAIPAAAIKYITGTACHERNSLPKIEIMRRSKIFGGITKEPGSQSQICARIRYFLGTEYIIAAIIYMAIIESAAIPLRAASDIPIIIIAYKTEVTIRVPYIISDASPAVSEREYLA